MENNKAFLKWLKRRPDGKALLFTTQTEFSYEDYLEHCQAVGIDNPAADESHEFHEWCQETAQNYYRDDLDNCRNSKNLKRSFVVTGSLGLWWGHPDIKAVICDDFDDMMSKVVSGSILDVTAKYDTRCIYFDCGHHDGCNNFEVYLVKPDADKDLLQRRIDDDKFDPYGYDRRFLEKITDYLI